MWELSERKPFITGNWKMNPKSRTEAIDLAQGIVNCIKSDNKSDVGLFVPFPFLDSVKNVVGDSIIVGAEMVTPELSGAFTGGVSPLMLKSIGVTLALVGHSERRTINKETDEDIHAQCRILVEQEMNVILCIGESLEEFEKDLAPAVCAVQLKKALAGMTAEEVTSHITIAYEPVWAIGTGKVATPKIAQTVHETIRGIVRDMYDDDVAARIRILYGGSVTPDSVDGLLSQPDIDGALVGGASLSSNSFGRIINFQPPSRRRRALRRIRRTLLFWRQ
eukprot:CAMPEP_0194257770 /NCGR_PEP_ID=MMETSP0158-20130606/39860_1 /TAXON_ID=33649 /ORGANISM="Thalassionema nitzschioides, Strain L26-B" /LENGTH=277 /DNA_ID=CAMNT_0038996933 /DNA_START=202 /DNA_END=1035 /DNA_ORIENTATION=+